MDTSKNGCDGYVRWKSLVKDKWGTYQTSHSSVMGACRTALEEVDRNHPMTLVVGARWEERQPALEEVDRNRQMT